MIIETAKKTDFEKIHEIFVEVHDLHLNGTINTFKDIDPFTKEEFDTMIKDKKTFILVARSKTIEGFIIGEITEREGRHTKFKRTMEVHTLGVKKDLHNKGIGTLLMNEIKRIAKDKKCDNIKLSVWSFNENAIKFYKHNGFQNKKINMEINL